MKIKFNNETIDYDLMDTDSGNIIYSSLDCAFGKEACGYHFLKNYLHINDELINGYDRFSISLDNLDNINGAVLFNEEGKVTRRIDENEIDAILQEDKDKASFIVFNGENSDNVISFLTSNNVKAYQEDSGRLRVAINGKMETIFKDDKISIDNNRSNRVIVNKPDYVTKPQLKIQDINSIVIIQPDEDVITSMESSIANLEKELTYYPNDRAIMEQLDNTLDELQDEKNSQSFLIAYSSEYSETPSYDTFSQEAIQELFKDMPIEDFKHNIVPYLKSEELKEMLDAIYPLRNENIAIQDELKTSVDVNKAKTVEISPIR